MKAEDSFALYVHVPFCERKCPYCAFYSLPGVPRQTIENYAESLALELKAWSKQSPWNRMNVNSIFFGGGTPSLLPQECFNYIAETINECYGLTENLEWTIEVNPASFTIGKCDAWTAAGVNRISLGVQSFDNNTLNHLGRLHTAGLAESVYHELRSHRINNCNLDLMFGIHLPDDPDGKRTLAAWDHTLHKAIRLQPEHLSIYALTVEDNTPFGRDEANGKTVKVQEEVERNQYLGAINCLASEGWNQYEVSNWAKTGYQSRQNHAYWGGTPYLGVGPAAHSFTPSTGTRFWTPANLDKWAALVAKKGVGIDGHETLSAGQRFEEILMLGLRKVEGVQEDVLRNNAHAAGTPWPPKLLGNLLEQGLLVRDRNTIRYSPDGMLLADSIEAMLTAEVNE